VTDLFSGQKVTDLFSEDEECGVVTRGSVEMALDEQASVLSEGDWYFSLTTLYEFRNIGADEVVNANTPADLDAVFIDCWMRSYSETEPRYRVMLFT
jgi:hypothetical protein